MGSVHLLIWSIAWKLDPCLGLHALVSIVTSCSIPVQPPLSCCCQLLCFGGCVQGQAEDPSRLQSYSNKLVHAWPYHVPSLLLPHCVGIFPLPLGRQDTHDMLSLSQQSVLSHSTRDDGRVIYQHCKLGISKSPFGGHRFFHGQWEVPERKGILLSSLIAEKLEGSSHQEVKWRAHQHLDLRSSSGKGQTLGSPIQRQVGGFWGGGSVGDQRIAAAPK